MANAIALGVQFTASASGMTKGLSQVDRVLQNLGKQASGAARLFDAFAGSSSAAAAAQQQVATDVAFLNSALKTGQVSAEQYATELNAITQAAQQQAAAFAEGARLTESVATAEEKRARQLANLTSLRQAGAISEETYARAVEQASGAAAASAAATAAAEQARARAVAEGAAITASVQTVEEKRAVQLERLDALLAANAISEETYARAVEQASGAAAAAAAATADSERERARAVAEGAAVTASVQTDQEKRAAQLERLDALLAASTISEETHARAVAEASGANAAAEAAEAARLQTVQEGAQISARYATAEEKRAATLARLDELFDANAISLETYNRASADALGINRQAAQSEQERAALSARAGQIVEANLTAQERASRDYATAVAELDRLRDAGLLGEQDYAKALDRSANAYAKATIAANKYDTAAEGASGSLKFNEAVGALSALPGPLGNIAGRVSGLASAGEGLSRIFSGGLAQGFASLGTTVASVVNPFTLAVAGVAAFGTAAVAVARGLVDLEDRVEQLGNLADQLGVSFEFIQVLEEAASRSGVSLDTLAGSMTRLQKTLAGADEESKSAQAALSRLGISIEELNGLSQQEQITLIGDRISSIEEPAKRTAAAVALFGKSGATLLPFFNNLEPAAVDFERLGGSLSALDRDRIDEFGAGLDALGVASGRLGELLLVPFVGLGEGITQGSAEFIGGINAIVSVVGDVLEPFLSGLGAAIKVVGVVLGGIGRSIGAAFAPLGDLFQTIGGFSDAFNEAFVDVVRFLVDASVATTEWIVSFSPVALLVDGIEALSAGFSQLSGSLAPVAELAQRIGTVVVAAFTQLSTAVGEAVSTTIGYVVDAVASFAEFTGISSLITTFASSVTDAFNGIWEGIRNVVSSVGGFIERVVTFAETWLGIERTIETPLEPTLDLTQPSLAATQFASEIGAAATAASEFGQAGFQAALSYQTALEQIAELQADGTLTADEAKKAADLAKQSFEGTLDVLEKEAEAQKAAAEEATKAADEKVKAAERAANAAIEADRRRADSFIQTQGLGGEDPATKAAEDLLAITRQIDEAETAIVEARASSDAAAEQAATRRLAILDQAQAAAQETLQFGFSTQDAEKAITDVREQIDETFTFENFQIAPDAFTTAQEQLRQLEQDLRDKTIDPQTFEIAADAIRSGFEDALETAEKIADLNEKYAEQAAEIEKERLDNLNKLGPATVKANDVRTSEGASQFLQLATGQQDPAIEEYRKQLSKLDDIKREIAKIGGTVEIVGAG